MRSLRLTRALLLSLSLVAGCSVAAKSPVKQAALVSDVKVGASAIAWQPWGQEAFARAASEHKLLLVDVGIEGCTACRSMHEDTYRNRDIARRINEHFVPVAIDADVQPDLGERFEEWGWPATIFLAPNGVQVKALRGSRDASDFAEILDAMIAAPDDEPCGGEAETQPAATARATLEEADLEARAKDARARLDAMGDEHGWGGAERIALAPPIEEAFMRAHVHGEDASGARARAALAGEAKILDPVWGGVYVAATTRDWDDAIVEKRTMQEAHALASFATGLHATEDNRWLAAAREVHRYLRDFMLAPDGTFYSTQKDDAPGLPANMSATEYYALPDAERRLYGIPGIDHAVYTDQNGMVIEAYARLYEATGDRDMLAVATRAADVLLRERRTPSGAMIQFREAAPVLSDTRLRRAPADDRVYLNAQSEMGLALVALARVTGDSRWIEAASKLAVAARESLGDKESGGYFSATERPTDALFARRKPFYDNVQYARFLTELSRLTKDAQWRREAETIVHAVATREALDQEGVWAMSPYALLMSELSMDPIDMTVVTSASDPRADALLARAVRLYEPRKVVRFEAPGHYPDRGRPALYICTKSACSSPVYEPADVARAAAPYLAEKK